MKCPSCLNNNPPGSRFCSTCGNYLMPDTQQTASSADSERGTALQQAEGNKEELRRLKELLAHVDKRLETLERMQGEPASQAPVSPAPQRVPPSVPIQETPPVSAFPSPARKAAPRKTSEWEMIFGGNWLARIGVLALFIGIAFFIKFAIDKGWLSPTIRVILGVLAGSGMIGGGYFWRKRYPTLAQTLSGGGIAVLYLSIFAAFAFFQMLNVYAAVALLFLICAGSAALALSYSSLPLALMGIIGAFGAPFVLGLGHTGGTGQAVTGTWPQLLIYILAVDLSVIYISRFRDWQWFTLLAFFGSLVTYAGWYRLYGHNGSLFLTEGSLTVLFLIFTGVVLLNNMRRKAPIETDLVLLVVNAPVYLFASYALMCDSLRGWMGAFTLALSLSQAALGLVLRNSYIRRRPLGIIAYCIALAALTIAIPVQFKEGMWTTILWAAEFVVLAWAALRLKISWLMGFGMLAFVLMGIKLLRFDSMVDISTYQPLLNSRVLVFIAGIAASYLVAYLIKRAKEKAEQWMPFTTVLFVAANFLTLLVLSLELWGYFSRLILSASSADRIRREK